MRRLDKAEELVRRRVCDSCAPPEKVCERPAPERCVLFDLFPLVVQAIGATEGRSLEDYRQAIQEHVCPVCADAALDLSCHLRDQMRCALDQHLGEVVEAVRQARGAAGKESELAAAPAGPAITAGARGGSEEP